MVKKTERAVRILSLLSKASGRVLLSSFTFHLTDYKKSTSLATYSVGEAVGIKQKEKQRPGENTYVVYLRFTYLKIDR